MVPGPSQPHEQHSFCLEKAEGRQPRRSLLISSLHSRQASFTRGFPSPSHSAPSLSAVAECHHPPFHTGHAAGAQLSQGLLHAKNARQLISFPSCSARSHPTHASPRANILWGSSSKPAVNRPPEPWPQGQGELSRLLPGESIRTGRQKGRGWKNRSH